MHDSISGGDACAAPPREAQDQLERQRNVLIRDVHHRIKNSLQGVAGILRQHAQEHPETAPVLERAIAQVRAVAVVHGLEGQAFYNEVVLCEMAPSIARMVEEMFTPACRVDIRVDVPERVRVIDRERVPVALILNELIFNAAKHARGADGARDDRVSVRVAWLPELDSARISVTNAGRLPSHFDFAAGSGIGTGLELVASMLPTAGAELSISATAEGVEARLLLSPPVIYSVGKGA